MLVRSFIIIARVLENCIQSILREMTENNKQLEQTKPKENKQKNTKKKNPKT